MGSPYFEPVLAWYPAHARDLPWRAPRATPWSVLVSEVMLQQTPVSRVLPAHHAWLARWPSAPALAADPPGEAVRQWGRLGYPRRALRLHATAAIVTQRHGGQIPSSREELLALPGIGAYTAAAVAAFAFGRRHAVLDTNVRRVLARLVSGRQFPGPRPSAAEYRLAESLLPADPAVAARWSVAVMELGALTCTAARPRCTDCPVAPHCAWLAAGQPASASQRPIQRYEGTDRQCRGRLLALLRESPGPVLSQHFDAVWPDNVQRARALDGLVSDGLVDPLPDGSFALPALRLADPRVLVRQPPIASVSAHSRPSRQPLPLALQRPAGITGKKMPPLGRVVLLAGRPGRVTDRAAPVLPRMPCFARSRPRCHRAAPARGSPGRTGPPAPHATMTAQTSAATGRRTCRAPMPQPEGRHPAMPGYSPTRP